MVAEILTKVFEDLKPAYPPARPELATIKVD
jgi:hypothetical protein